MACEYVCDGCGKREPAVLYPGGLFKPAAWYERSDEDGVQHACSRECIEKVARTSGKTSVVLPI